MRLTPANFKCTDHGDDLTAAVTAELGEIPAMSFGVNFARLLPRRKTQDFTVVVTCPSGGSHQVICRGRVDRAN